MTKPAWSPEAFLRRVRMSARAKLFIVTEGTGTDKWFYEEICLTSPKLKAAGYEIYPIDFVSRGHNTAVNGGKSRVLDLYRLAKEKKALTSRNKRHPVSIMFCVDSDHDRLTNQIVRSRHVTYTKLPDPEAHLFDSFDVIAFSRRSQSASTNEAEQFERWLGDWREAIAQSWREWFELCLTAHYCGLKRPVPGTPPKLSDHNSPACDSEAISKLENRIVELVGQPEFEQQRARSKLRLDRLFASRQGHATLKGKWLIGHLRRRANQFASSHRLQALRSDEAVREAVKGAAIFTPSWTAYYTRRFEALIAG